MLAFLLDAYVEDEAPNAKGKMEKRTVLRLDPRLARVKVASSALPQPRAVPEGQGSRHRPCASTGTSTSTTRAPSAAATVARTRSAPRIVTVDFDTLDDNAVTVRERDSIKQERVFLDQIEGYLAARLIGC